MSEVRSDVKRRPISIVVVIFSCLLLYSCEQDVKGRSISQKRKFVIAIVGDGVNGSEGERNTIQAIGSVGKSEATINARQGMAMWKGAEIAFNHSPQLHGMRKLFLIKGYDDKGRKEVARKIALYLRKDPYVMTVIGHATSGTTREAAVLYSQVGMPLLMPIATSPMVAFPPNSEMVEEKRLQNYFRLPPSDDRVQAPAVAIFAIENLKAKKCFLLRDISVDARDYSATLTESLEELIPECRILQAAVEVNRAASFEPVAMAIIAESPDVVIFCGYGTTAHRLLHTLFIHLEYDAGIEHPRFILTDGCKISDLNTSGFETYVTFPAPDLKSNSIKLSGIQSDEQELNILKKYMPFGIEQSYHIYGYDAILLMAASLTNLQKEEISRRSLLEQLRNNSNSFCGIAGEYDFAQGESQRAGYFVYKVNSDTSAKSRFEFKTYISYRKIRRYLGKKM